MAKPRKRGLGKGLGALISTTQQPGTAQPLAPGSEADGARLLELDPRIIKPNPQQPRQNFDEESLQELADSIRRDGIQEPVIVRQKDGEYQLVSGERRVRASILAELEAIPTICRDVSDQDMLKLGIIENIQREDLNAIELAHAYQTLVKEFNWTQEELANQIGKKRVTVTNVLRLLNLPPDVQRHVVEGEITGGHGRALLALNSPRKQSAACRKIIEQGLSVRQAEKLAAPKKARGENTPVAKDPNVLQLEDELRRRFGTRVTLRTSPKNRGKIEIEYFGLDDLERILSLLRS